MAESPKLRRLRDIRQSLVDDKLTNIEKKRSLIADTDGRQVRLSDPDALEVIDRRIAAEEASEN